MRVALASIALAGSAAGCAAGPPWWRPSVGTSWQIQLTGPVDLDVDATVVDLDLFDTSARTVDRLHDRGRHVICYFTVGSKESYRRDTDALPDAVTGKGVDGWPQERWLDIRRIDALAPVLRARFDLCAAKHFDGVDGDWMDNQTQDTGFPITASDQLAFNRWLIDQGHRRGLAVGVKNDLSQAPTLASEADFEIDEQCAEFHECDTLLPWIRADKPVLHIEYNLPAAAFCASTTRLGFSSLRKHVRLDAWRRPC